MSSTSTRAFAVVMAGAAPRHAFNLIEMQGEVVFADETKAIESLHMPGDAPLGTLLLPENGKGCTLRMGTLSLAGDAGNVKTPLLVLKKRADVPTSVKRRRTEDGPVAGCDALAAPTADAASKGPTAMLVSEAWEAGLLDGDDADAAADDLCYEVVGTVVRRYHFKSKTTRQFNK